MTLNFELVPIDQPDRWNQVLRSIPHGYWHDWRACHAMHLGTALSTFLCVAHDAEGIVAACPMAEREWEGSGDVFTPVGFSGFVGRHLDESFASAWSAFAASQGFVAGYFALHPVFSAARAHTGLASDNEVFILDLEGGADAVVSRCDRSVRRAMKAWEQSGQAYVTDRDTLTGFIIDNYAGCMLDLGVDPRAILPPASLASMCNDPAMLMVGVHDDRGVCAVHTFAMTPHGAECHLNFSIRDGRRFTSALICWGIRQLADRGIAWINLGGGVASGDTLAQSKMKFRPRRVPFVRAREIYDPDRFSLLCARAGIDPGRTCFHPAYRLARGIGHHTAAGNAPG